jgi:hypothetical protein
MNMILEYSAEFLSGSMQATTDGVISQRQGGRAGRLRENRGENSNYSKCQKFFPNYPENPFFEKSRFPGPFRKKRLSYSEITLMLFRTLPVAPGCNKVSENEKTFGNRYSRLSGGTNVARLHV